jgi:hypothetical protein
MEHQFVSSFWDHGGTILRDHSGTMGVSRFRDHAMPKIVLTADIVERARATSRLVELVDTYPKANGLTLRITTSGAK